MEGKMRVTLFHKTTLTRSQAVERASKLLREAETPVVIEVLERLQREARKLKPGESDPRD